MNSLFIKRDEIIEVKIYTSKIKDGSQMVVANKREILEKNDQVNPETIIEDIVKFRKPSYGDDVSILSRNVNMDGAGDVKFNPASVRYSRFITLLKDWTFKDESGNKVEPTAENVNAMHPELANFIIDGLEEKLGSQ